MKELLEQIGSVFTSFWQGLCPSFLQGTFLCPNRSSDWCDDHFENRYLNQGCHGVESMGSSIHQTAQGIADSLGVDVSYVYLGTSLMVIIPSVGAYLWSKGKGNSPKLLSETETKRVLKEKDVENGQGNLQLVTVTPVRRTGGFQKAMSKDTSSSNKSDGKEELPLSNSTASHQDLKFAKQRAQDAYIKQTLILKWLDKYKNGSDANFLLGIAWVGSEQDHQEAHDAILTKMGLPRNGVLKTKQDYINYNAAIEDVFTGTDAVYKENFKKEFKKKS